MDRDEEDRTESSTMKKVRATEFSIKALMKDTPKSSDKTPSLTIPTLCTPTDLAANQLMFNMALSQLQEKFLETLRHRNSFYSQNHPAYAGALSSSLPGFVPPYCSGLPRPRLDLFHEYQNRQWIAPTKRNHNFLSQHSGFDYSHGVLALNKPKRIRTAFSPNQLVQLEASFDGNPYVVGQERRDLAIRLGLTETQVKVWFQNRRTKEKRGKPEEDMLRESD